MSEPVGPTVYRVYDEWDRLIYVGSTKQIAKRLVGHRYMSWWSGLTARVDVEHFDTMDEARAAEMEAIRTEDPAYNVFRPDGLQYFPITDYEVQVCRDWVAGARTNIRLGYVPRPLHRLVAPHLNTWRNR
jgi:excinuclease UvrABC nuclease subunit